MGESEWRESEWEIVDGTVSEWGEGESGRGSEFGREGEGVSLGEGVSGRGSGREWGE